MNRSAIFYAQVSVSCSSIVVFSILTTPGCTDKIIMKSRALSHEACYTNISKITSPRSPTDYGFLVLSLYLFGYRIITPLTTFFLGSHCNFLVNSIFMPQASMNMIIAANSLGPLHSVPSRSSSPGRVIHPPFLGVICVEQIL